MEIAKSPDSTGLLRCTRGDGTVTWQKQPKHGAHFALHDLTHFAVETVLGYSGGFFGLISQGWELDDTTGKGAREPLPPEAVEVERIVGLFDAERGSGSQWSVEEFNAFAPRRLTEEDIWKIRARRGELFQRWREVPAGQKLQLEFQLD